MLTAGCHRVLESESLDDELERISTEIDKMYASLKCDVRRTQRLATLVQTLCDRVVSKSVNKIGCSRQLLEAMVAAVQRAKQEVDKAYQDTVLIAMQQHTLIRVMCISEPQAGILSQKLELCMRSMLAHATAAAASYTRTICNWKIAAGFFENRNWECT